MTQRIFDIENEKDMADLWDILQDHIIKLVQPFMSGYLYPKYVLARSEDGEYELPININWHDKTEITRPIQEATEADLGKWCRFWDNCCEDIIIGKLTVVERNKGHTYYRLGDYRAFDHCHRLTKQEIEELC